MTREDFVVAVGPRCELSGTWEQTFDEREIHLAIRGSRSSLASTESACAVFVGELDNALHVARLLGVEAHPASADPARLTIRAWQRWGQNALDKLVGPFAGAYVDLRARTVTVFRDLTAGVPVYLTFDSSCHVAGSDLGLISAWNGRRREPAPLFIAGYLQNSSVGRCVTPFVNVFSLEPGAIARPELSTGWKQRRIANWHVLSIRHKTLEDYVDDFAQHLDSAVRRRIRNHRTVSVSLSGGLDSTNVLASAARVASDVELVAYGIPFYDPKGDERHVQGVVAAHCGAQLKWVDVAGRGPTGVWSGQLFAGRVAPPWAGNWFFGDALAEAAAEDEVPIMLDGEDADSLLSGSKGYLSDLFVRGRWLAWRRQARRLGERDGVAMSSLLKLSIAGLLPPSLVHKLGATDSSARVSPLVSPTLVEQTHLAELLRGQPWVRVWSPGRRFAAQQRVAAETQRVDEVVTEIGNPFRKMGVVDAHPFFDRELMRFCFGLPWHAVHNGTTPKILLRKLAERRLPPEFSKVVRKANLSEYYDQAVFEHERETIEAGLDLAGQRPDWISPAGLSKLRDKFDRKQDAWMPSRVAMLMLWSRQLERGRDCACEDYLGPSA